MNTRSFPVLRGVPYVCALALCALSSWAAEIDCSGTKKSKAAISREVIRPDDDSAHEMILAVRTHAISSRSPALDGSELKVYAFHDEYQHTGSQTGYFIYALKDGEKIWARFDSVNSMAGKEDLWEVTYQGVFRFLGGSGKYAAIRGGGHYQGKVRPVSGFDETFVCAMEY